MQKRVDYIIEDEQNSSGASSVERVYSPETLTEAYAAAVTAGQLMQVSAHSIGLLFEQSVNQQNNTFLMGNSNCSVQVVKILSGKKKT